LDSTHLSIGAGEYVAVSGRSGSGKSTLLNVVGLLDRLDSGSYELLGTRIDELRPDEIDHTRASVFGFVFQAFHLVPYLTAWENVELGLTYRAPHRKTRRSAVDAALAGVNLAHRGQARASVLSGGERQRVAIARALVRSPRVLLADEPTGNLDEENAAAVLDLFDEVNASGVTILMVTHDRTTAGRARREITMRDGRVVGDTAVAASAGRGTA